VHRREGDTPYKVDYYRMLTGDPSRITIKNPGDDSEHMEFYKLSSPRFVTSCADCIEKEDVLNDLERLFSGVPEDEEDKA
jgi:hypothetical protein